MADGWGRSTWSSGSWGEGVDATVRLGGWGRAAWGAGPWSESLGLEAVGAVGSITVIAESNGFVSGVVGTTALGNVDVTGDSDNVTVLGNAATGTLGTVTTTADANVSVTGLVGTTALGNANVQQGTGTAPAGVVGTIGLGYGNR